MASCLSIEDLTSDSLTLVRDFDSLPGLSQNYPCYVFLCGYCSLFCLVLDERYALAAGDGSRLPESLEAAKDRGQGIYVVSVGQVLDEENLIRRQVFVRDDSGSGGVARLEPDTTSRLRRTGRHVLRGADSLEPLLLFSLGSSSFVLVSNVKSVSFSAQVASEATGSS